MKKIKSENNRKFDAGQAMKGKYGWIDIESVTINKNKDYIETENVSGWEATWFIKARDNGEIISDKDN